MSTEPVLFNPAMTSAELFSPGALDKVLEKIHEKARAEASADVSTGKARATIASLAHRVARSKTIIDDAGRELTAEMKAKVAAIDAERRRARESLDALKAEVVEMGRRYHG